jgi:hypothetical protein
LVYYLILWLLHALPLDTFRMLKQAFSGKHGVIKGRNIFYPVHFGRCPDGRAKAGCEEMIGRMLVKKIEGSEMRSVGMVME